MASTKRTTSPKAPRKKTSLTRRKAARQMPRDPAMKTSLRGSEGARLVAEPRLIRYCGLRMVRLEEGSAFLLGRAQRNGYHVDLYVYDLYFQLLGRVAEVASFVDVECTDVTETYPPSRLALRAPSVGLEVTAKKHGTAMQLHLQLPGPDPQLVSLLSDWTTDDEVNFGRSVTPELAETAIVELVALLRRLFPQTAATPPRGASGGPAGSETA